MASIYIVSIIENNGIYNAEVFPFKDQAEGRFITISRDFYDKDFKNINEVFEYKGPDEYLDDMHPSDVDIDEIAYKHQLCLPVSEYEKYPYEVYGKHLNLYDTQKYLDEILPEYEFAKLDELEFSEKVYDLIREGELSGIKERFYLQYRGGEIEKVIYATSEEEALRKAVEWNHHPEFWEIVED